MCTDLIKEFEKKLASANGSPRKSRSPSRKVRFSPENTPSKKDTLQRQPSPKKVPRQPSPKTVLPRQASPKKVVPRRDSPKKVAPRNTSPKKEAKKEFSVTAKVHTDPVLHVEVEQDDEEEDLRGTESSKLVGRRFSWRMLASIPVLVSVGILAYLRIYRPDAHHDVNAILDNLKKNIVKHF